MKCPNCGGDMVGDGYTTVLHCESVDLGPEDAVEPDAGPVMCHPLHAVYFVSPAMTGKTHNKEALKRLYNCKKVFDDACPGMKAFDSGYAGCLFLTEFDPSRRPRFTGRVVKGLEARQALDHIRTCRGESTTPPYSRTR